QQVVLLGGQLMALLKALTAIKLAAERNAVPIFWLATEDHDLAEVSAVRVLSADHRLERLELAAQAPEGAPVGTVEFGEGISGILGRVAALLGENEIVESLRQTHTPKTTFGEATARLFTHLFAEFGLILIDSSDPEVHYAGAGLLSAAAERS